MDRAAELKAEREKAQETNNDDETEDVSFSFVTNLVLQFMKCLFFIAFCDYGFQIFCCSDPPGRSYTR